MNEPKVQEDVVPDEGASPAANPEGRTPFGIPVDVDAGEPAARANGERFATEIAALEIEKGK